MSHQELETISESTKRVFWKLSRIVPPEQDASPRTKNSFRTAITSVVQAAGQALATAVGLGQLVPDEHGNPPNLGLTAKDWHDIGPEPESEDDRDEAQGNVSAITQDQVDDELEHIFANSEGVVDDFYRYSVSDFFKMVVNGGHNGKVVEEEREAYRRLLIGYKKTSHLTISTCFAKFRVTRTSVLRTANQAIQIGEIVDLATRLEERESLIFRGSSEDSITSYLLTVIRNIEGYKACEDWKGQSQEFRKEFISNFARSLLPDAFERLDNLGIPEKKKKTKYTKLITPIRTKHCKMMEQRERFRDLYLQFGPIALLDPTFMKTGDKKNFPRMSKLSLAVYKAVIRRVEDQDLGQIRYGDHLRFVVGVLEELGGERVGAYIKQFLEDNCYWDLEEDEESESEQSGEEGQE
ncbi:hypothetical protein BDP27DRAFT_1425058 [Rhodocollybia butyracea]|uniref:Uncharacterized protein n=1 Tax=Rhodocollybia butyracea TaxID=206335 RepID=A0A9P5PL40_9AGAR|nr:hypothetical protein BDP27DRAFT_1425058 [Rhodocollybia butyracea]